MRNTQNLTYIINSSFSPAFVRHAPSSPWATLPRPRLPLPHPSSSSSFRPYFKTPPSPPLSPLLLHHLHCPPSLSTASPPQKQPDTTITDRVFIDFSICPSYFQTRTLGSYLALCPDTEPVGRIVLGLYGNLVPITVSNFKSMCTGVSGYYKGTLIQKIFPGRFFMAEHQGRRDKGEMKPPDCTVSLTRLRDHAVLYSAATAAVRYTAPTAAVPNNVATNAILCHCHPAFTTVLACSGMVNFDMLLFLVFQFSILLGGS
ncbi:hypothetical protein L1887_30246 [Cichorium endivia]|nr:hypothetical protein L1887_30246 [Cichorium endivia]